MSLEVLKLFGVNMSELKRPDARRCLFGRADPIQQELALKAQEEIFEPDTKRMRETWGLDPISGKPVAGGKYQCTEMSPAEFNKMPEFYKKVYAPRSKRDAKRKLDFSEDEEEELNDENRASLDNRVPSNGHIIVMGTSQLPVKETGALRSRLSDSCGLCSSSAPDLSPHSRHTTDMKTPPTRSKEFRQSTLQDYMPVKKARIQSKALPRS